MGLISALELIFLEGVGSHDEYKIVKTVKHTRTAVTLYVRYKIISTN